MGAVRDSVSIALNLRAFHRCFGEFGPCGGRGGGVAGGTTLLLIDDHPLFHAGLGAILRTLRPGWRLLAAHEAAAGLALMDAEPDIDLALVDLGLPGLNGFDAVAAFGRAHPQTPRVVISGREDAAARLRARRSGASGFIAKAWDGARIAAAIDRVLAGGVSFDDEGPVQAGGRGDGFALTDRQIEVLTLLAEGLPNKVIEDRLGIAERTVRAHLTEVFQALGASTRTQAVLQAQKLGLIP